MSHASLAAQYRPQSFADVTGQDTVKTILSRAAAENRVAPAYLLSGTRGVGKTTIARIFAKALNCTQAPIGDPCNQCEACKRITQGNHVDVIEIDGASNRGVDDARRLREAVSYAPMEGRYKVFIIDEAHMLTNESFNSLLKTLEEPPPRVTFILATTEAHKFPVTIVSRCQHFVFKALSEAELTGHLTRILHKEQRPFDESAVRLIARRAAGSVRDGMSLMGQTLALGGDTLTEASVRNVLGLAGQELYEQLLTAFQAQDCLAVVALTKEMLDNGVDLGFFLRELALLWRNLFLIKQAGPQAFAALDMPEGEKERLLALTPGFTLTYIHAAWHMVLESQRQVLTSLEPATALELLLLNLTLLTRLVSMDTLSKATASPTSGAPAATPQDNAPTQAPSPAPTRTPSTTPQAVHAQAMPTPAIATRNHAPVPTAPHKPAALPTTATPYPVNEAPQGHALTVEPSGSATSVAPTPIVVTPVAATPSAPVSVETSVVQAGTETPDPLSWQGFLAHCEANLTEGSPGFFQHLKQVQGTLDAEGIVLHTHSLFQYEQLVAPSAQETLQRWASTFTPTALPVRVNKPVKMRKTESELKQELSNHPVIKSLEAAFDASIMRCLLIEE